MIEVLAERSTVDGDEVVSVRITDDGVGLPAGFQPGSAGLGTRIVMSLVQDLRGTIQWDHGDPAGTVVTFEARLRPLERERWGA